MEFKLSEKEKAFYEEVEEFLKKELPSDWAAHNRAWPGGYASGEIPGASIREAYVHYRQKLIEKGWLTITWPKEYGGREYSYMEKAIFDERTSYYRAPNIDVIAVGMVGPTILKIGTEEQKKEWLPRIASGEVSMWLGYSEPNAGSDLAGIQTTAVKDGEAYVIEGVKHFVENAHVADKIICAAQVKGKAGDEAGLKLFLVDGDSPGIRIKPFKTLGYEKQCEVVFDSVRVKKGDVLGAPAEAGQIILTIEERAAVAKCAEMVGALQSSFSMTVTYAKEREQFGRPIGSFQAVQHHLANMAVDVDSSRFITYQAAWKISEGLPAGMEAAMAKAFTSEAAGRVTRLGHQVHGAISFCDEHDMHLYYRKAKAASLAFGDAEYYLEKVADNLGLH